MFNYSRYQKAWSYPAGMVNKGTGDRRYILRAVEPTTTSARLLRPLVPTTMNIPMSNGRAISTQRVEE